MSLYTALFEWTNIHWITIILVLHTGLSLFTSLHILLFKENADTSLAWIGLVILSPVLGSMFYWFFGINRIKRSAQRIYQHAAKAEALANKPQKRMPPMPANWQLAMRAGYTVHPLNYLSHNCVEPLINGDVAYPAMIRAIHNANQHIVLSSYIFEYDSLGRQFVDALVNAHERGVVVNVLLDGVGISYSWHKSDRALKKHGVKTARFLPAISLSSIRFINLRNHRKILCVDGNVAFVGGMNISKNNEVQNATHPIDDIHFKVSGEVIDQISQVFAEDWFFATGESIDYPAYRAPNDDIDNACSVVARVIKDGPDEDRNKIRWTLINALACAEHNIRIMTPYFIPDTVLMTSLHAAALRGIEVEIIVPGSNNIFFVDWALQANLARITEHGIKIYRNKRPFDHSKMLVIDDVWSFIGSTNWDARSLEFNFEINLECFDHDLNTKLTDFFALKKQNANLVTKAEIEAVPTIIKIRNNLFRLFSPYL